MGRLDSVFTCLEGEADKSDDSGEKGKGQSLKGCLEELNIKIFIF